MADPYMKDTTNRPNGQPGLAPKRLGRCGFSANPARLDRIGPQAVAKSQREHRMSMPACRSCFSTERRIEFVRRERYDHCSEPAGTHSIHLDDPGNGMIRTKGALTPCHRGLCRWRS